VYESSKSAIFENREWISRYHSSIFTRKCPCLPNRLASTFETCQTGSLAVQTQQMSCARKCHGTHIVVVGSSLMSGFRVTRHDLSRLCSESKNLSFVMGSSHEDHVRIKTMVKFVPFLVLVCCQCLNMRAGCGWPAPWGPFRGGKKFLVGADQLLLTFPLLEEAGWVHKLDGVRALLGYSDRNRIHVCSKSPCISLAV
jgi:hypothetical protein